MFSSLRKGFSTIQATASGKKKKKQPHTKKGKKHQNGIKNNANAFSLLLKDKNKRGHIKGIPSSVVHN